MDEEFGSDLGFWFEHIDDLIFDTRAAIESLDEFAPATIHFRSALDWLLPFLEETREQQRHANDVMDLWDQPGDPFSVIATAKIVCSSTKRCRWS